MNIVRVTLVNARGKTNRTKVQRQQFEYSSQRIHTDIRATLSIHFDDDVIELKNTKYIVNVTEEKPFCLSFQKKKELRTTRTEQKTLTYIQNSLCDKTDILISELMLFHQRRISF